MSNTLDLDQWATIKQLASEHRVNEAALRMFLRLHRDTVETRKIGSAVLVRRHDLLQRYEPKSAR